MALYILVDYDNVPRSLLAPGPVAVGKTIFSRLPAAVVADEQQVTVRLYGGWRSGAQLTRAAQKLTPRIAADSPTFVPRPGVPISAALVRLVVELATAPIGASAPFENTLAKERTLRSFRPRASNASPCSKPSACGLGFLSGLTHSTACTTLGCGATAQEMLVRDEQKMVDTLMVADMAHLVFFGQAQDVVVVTSDTDIWPGVLLAIKAGCAVTQVHAIPNMRTPHALVSMLPNQVRNYFSQVTI